MALYSAKTWVDIHGLFFGTEYHKGLGLHRETFLVRLSLTAHIHDI